MLTRRREPLVVPPCAADISSVSTWASRRSAQSKRENRNDAAIRYFPHAREIVEGGNGRGGCLLARGEALERGGKWPCDTHVYRRRKALLHKAIEDLSVTERSASLEAKLAAAIGARLANWGE